MSNIEDRILTFGLIAAIAGGLYIFRDKIFGFIQNPTGGKCSTTVCDEGWTFNDYPDCTCTKTVACPDGYSLDPISQTCKSPPPSDEAIRLTEKWNAGFCFTHAEYEWLRINEPTLFNISRDRECPPEDSHGCNLALGHQWCADYHGYGGMCIDPTTMTCDSQPFYNPCTGGAILWSCPPGWTDAGTAGPAGRCCYP